MALTFIRANDAIGCSFGCSLFILATTGPLFSATGNDRVMAPAAAYCSAIRLSGGSATPAFSIARAVDGGQSGFGGYGGVSSANDVALASAIRGGGNDVSQRG